MRILPIFLTIIMLTTTAISAAPPAPPATTSRSQPPFIAGGDISMLPEIEKSGGVFRDREGKAGDALDIMRAGGMNLFRVRLFVNPETDFNKSHGATQDLPYVVALSKRIKASGASLLLDLHYSDTWADPGKQFKPEAWKIFGSDFDALEKQVHDYT